MFSVDDLLVSLSNNIFDLFFSESLEVIWHESMRGKLGFSSCEVLLHDITHVGSLNFSGVLCLLILEPFRFTVSLLLSEHLIVLLHFFDHVSLSKSGLVLENLSHLSDGEGLIGIVFFFLISILIFHIVLSCLLHHPFFLQLCICSLSGCVGYINHKSHVSIWFIFQTKNR